MAEKVTLSFNELTAQAAVGDAYVDKGVTISVGNELHMAWVVDAPNPLVPPDDPAYGTNSKALIVAKDGDANDTNDNAEGGTVRFEFDYETYVYGFALRDIQEGASVTFYDGANEVIFCSFVPPLPNGASRSMDFCLEGVGAFEVTFVGAGAIDNVSYDLPVNFAPIAVDDQVTLDEDSTVVIDVLANDTDPEDDMLRVESASALNGVVTVNIDGTLTYSPNEGFVGKDQITYEIADVRGNTSSAAVIATVRQIDEASVALDGVVEGTSGDDLIDIAYTGDPQGDRIDAGDSVSDGAGPDDDTILAGAGDDVILARKGNDVIDAGLGNDLADGGAGDDSLLGGAGEDVLNGGLGNDFIDGGDGHDMISGGDGDDELVGGTGDDVIRSGAGSDTVDGGRGNDVIDTRASSNPLDQRPDIDYPGIYPADEDPFDDRDTVDGGAGDDIITTGDDRDIIDGGRGDDRIDAGVDDDIIDGGAGNDDIIGGEGNDIIDGGRGNDTIYAGFGPGVPDAVNIPDATDLRPNNGQDIVFGGEGDDEIFGADDDDLLFGGEGDDYIDGQIDDDVIEGNAGNDVLIGGQGADIISGGSDADTILVGAGEGVGDVVDGGTLGNDFDTLDLSGAGPLNVVVTATDPDGDSQTGYVEFLDAPAGAVVSRLDFTEIERIIPCFTPGTLIATPRGERPVEHLQAGDRVITRDNGIQEIRWAGRKEVDHLGFAAAPHLKPVMITKGSLGNGLPERDTLVSPNHRILVASDRTALYFEDREVLVSAKHLVDGKGVHRMNAMNTTYLHFMFDNHEVVLSNGAWSESFQPGDHALKGIGDSQRQEIFELFPELEDEASRADYASARRTLKKHEAELLAR
ncbi:MAG: Hint domain-containing protein [Pseudomonadota bacterium]